MSLVICELKSCLYVCDCYVFKKDILLDWNESLCDLPLPDQFKQVFKLILILSSSHFFELGRQWKIHQNEIFKWAKVHLGLNYYSLWKSNNAQFFCSTTNIRFWLTPILSNQFNSYFATLEAPNLCIMCKKNKLSSK